MKRFPKELARAVEPALTAARAVLDELDPDDVPASLRRVVAHSGPRLTPPLAAKLIAQLDALEWLRDDALQRLDDDAPAAARAFLEREGAWWADAALAVAEVSNRTQAREIHTLTQRLAKQAETIEATKAKLKHQKLDTKNGLVALRDEVKVLRKRAAAAEHTDAQGRAALENRIAALDAELAEMRLDMTETEQIVAELRRRLRAQRRELAVARRELESGGSSSTPKDPLLLARELDLAAASVPHRHRDDEPAAESPSPDGGRWGLPAGIRPDRAEAVDWLLERTEVTVIIDGYNLLFHLDPGEFTTGKARRQLGRLMGHVVRKAKGAVAIRIVFDSALPGHRDERWAAQGVQVTFAEAGRLADEEVVLLAASTSGPVVVVSSDREVREEAAAVGAVVLWSEAVVEWFSGQPVAMPPSK